MKKTLYYILSWTWGGILTIIGGLITLCLWIIGCPVYRHGGTIYVEVGDKWGGLEFGMFFLCNKKPTEHIKNHEFGHSLQNCLWGPLYIFMIWIPSMIRYHYRNFLQSRGKQLKTKYDDIWFEGQATKWGYTFYNKW